MGTKALRGRLFFLSVGTFFLISAGVKAEIKSVLPDFSKNTEAVETAQNPDVIPALKFFTATHTKLPANRDQLKSWRLGSNAFSVAAFIKYFLAALAAGVVLGSLVRLGRAPAHRI